MLPLDGGSFQVATLPVPHGGQDRLVIAMAARPPGALQVLWISRPKWVKIDDGRTTVARPLAKTDDLADGRVVSLGIDLDGLSMHQGSIGRRSSQTRVRERRYFPQLQISVRRIIMPLPHSIARRVAFRSCLKVETL